MAVISELIDAGLSLKEQGNHQAAIEHFRQLHATYPDHARIMFELAGSWQAFGVPEQALPLYRRLMAMPKSQGLPPKEMPRLYTQMGATLRMLGEFTESLEIIDEGVSLFPDYRPLRAYRMFALHSAGFHQNAMIEALELMLGSLAPTKWDLYEDEILAIVEGIRSRIPTPDTEDLAEWEFDEFWSEDGKKVTPETKQEAEDADADDDVSVDELLDEAHTIIDGDADTPEEDATDDTPDEQEAPPIVEGKITVDADEDDDESFEIEVKIIDKKKDTKPKAKKSPKKTKDKSQLGKKPVKIDIGHEDDEEEIPVVSDDDDTGADDDNAKPQSGKINIPIDFD